MQNKFAEDKLRKGGTCGFGSGIEKDLLFLDLVQVSAALLIYLSHTAIYLFRGWSFYHNADFFFIFNLKYETLIDSVFFVGLLRVWKWNQFILGRF